MQNELNKYIYVGFLSKANMQNTLDYLIFLSS